jgi:hypothetical protein
MPLLPATVLAQLRALLTPQRAPSGLGRLTARAAYLRWRAVFPGVQT